MTDIDRTKRQIVWSTSVIGGGTAAGLMIGVIRMKVLAALLGPAGIGLLGLFNTLMTTGVSVAGMAIDTTGVRQISGAVGDTKDERVARWGLWTFAWPLALLAMLGFWLLSEPVALLVIGSPDYASWVAWTGIGVAASILAAAQLAVIQSYRRIGDVARIKIVGAILTLVASVVSVYFLGFAGIIVALLSAPLAMGLAARWYGRKVPRLGWRPIPAPSSLKSHWKLLITLGTVVTVSAAIGSAGQLLGRTLIVKDLGLYEAGLFQASYVVSSLNMTLLLGAMMPDFYPRLSSAVGNPTHFRQIVNHQVHVALVLGAPVLVLLSVAAPLLLQLLYTSEFREAALLLRLQLIGDAMRVLGWALGLALLARAATWSYFAVEVVFTAIFVPVLWLLIPRIGLTAAGLAYVVAYSVTLATSAYLCARGAHARVDAGNMMLLLVVVLILSVVAALSIASPWLAIVFGVVASSGLAIYSLRELSRMGVPLTRAAVADFIRSKARARTEQP